MNRRLFFSVGEPSGDLHAANLIRALQAQSPGIQCSGFGGQRMIQAGFECDFDLTQMAVVGIAEVLPKLRQFFKIADQASEIFQRGLIDGVVLVDFPGFNWHIAKRAKKFGLPVYYYLPPQLWAWGGWRVQKIKANVDRVFCHLPFEQDWYKKRGVDAEYVGHPFFDDVASRPLDSRFLQSWSSKEQLQVAVLPGSRDHEVHGLWPIQLEIIKRLHARFPKVRFLVASLKESHARWCKEQMNDEERSLPIEIFVGKTSEILEVSDCSLMKSGSVSLELLARGIPATVIYRVSRLTYTLGMMFAQCDSFTLPNLIAGETLMPEYMAVGNPKKVVEQATESMSQLIEDPQHRQKVRQRMLELAEVIAKPGASQRTAAILLEPPSAVRTRPAKKAA